MPPLNPCAWSTRALHGGEDLVPAPGLPCPWFLARQRRGYIHLPIASQHILVMQEFDACEVTLQRLFQALRHHGQAILGAFPVTDSDLVIGKIDIFDPQAQACHQAQSGTIEHTRHERRRARELGQYGVDFFTREHNGETLGTFRPLQGVKLRKRLMQHMAIEKEEGIEGTIVCRGGDLFL